jgi:acyl carrier protein
MREIIDSVKKVIQQQLGIPPDSIVPAANLIDDLGADSLDSVELVMAFEEAFDMQIPDTLAETLHTVQDLIDLVNAHSHKALQA